VTSILGEGITTIRSQMELEDKQGKIFEMASHTMKPLLLNTYFTVKLIRWPNLQALWFW
jgi:hypothetical protein